MTLRNARIYKLEPQGLLDLQSQRVMRYRGHEVQKVQPRGCPRNGTMNQCFVQTLDGIFIGLVCESSLVATKRKAPLRDLAAESREARGLRFRGAR